MDVKERARRFAVWRTLEQVDWVATAEEIAAVTHIALRSVQYILRANGWERRMASRDTLIATDALPNGVAYRHD